MQSLPTLLFNLAAVTGALSVVGVFIGSSLYDIRHIRKLRPLQKTPKARRFRYRPLVSVIVISSNYQRSLEQTITSVFRSSYRKYEVIIIDNASSDKTKYFTKSLLQKHPKKTIRVVSKRKIASTSELMKSLHTYANGELILVINAATVLQGDTIKHAVNHFILDDELPAITLPTAPPPQYSVANHGSQLNKMVNIRVNKMKSVLHKPVCSPVFMYRRMPFSRLNLTLAYFASDALVYTKRNLWNFQNRLGAWLGWLGLGVITGYVWYLALHLQVLEPLGLLWTGLSLVSLLFLISDDSTSRGIKIRIVSLMPVWFVLYCLYVLKNILQPVVVSLLHVKYYIAKSRRFLATS